MPPRLLDPRHVDFDSEDRFLVGWRLRDHHPKGIDHERAPPELDPALAPAVGPLQAHAVHRRHVTPVGDGVAALDRTPGVELLRSVLGFLRRVPADRRRIAQDVRPLERGEPRTLRVPLVPAYESADAPDRGVERPKPEVARGEVELFVVRRIVGDVHLAVDPANLSIGVDHGCGVVIQARGPTLEQRRDDHDLRLTRGLAKRLRARTGNRLGEVERVVVFALGDVQRPEQLRQANKPRATSSGFTHACDRRLEVGRGVCRHAHLHEADHELLRRGGRGGGGHRG